MLIWAYLISVFAFLLNWEESKNEPVLRLWKKTPASYFREGLEIAALCFLNVLIVKISKSMTDSGAFETPLLWLMSYLAVSFWKKSNIYFLTVFGFSYYALIYENHLGWAQGLARIFAAGILMAAFRVLVTGLRKKILFAPVPKMMAGLPFLLFVTAVLSLCLSGAAQALSLIF